MSEPEFKLAALGIGAHPDDIELCCGGLMAKLGRLGHQTGIVDLTRGELATRGTPEGREQEAREAGKILKLSVRENLGFPDGAVGRNCPALSVDDQLNGLVEVFRRLRPEVVLLPYWEERHPDHVATSKLATDAIFLAGLRKFGAGTAGEKYVPRQVIYYQMRYELPPSFVIDVSEDIEAKYRAIDCYKSQFELPENKAKEKEPRTLLSSPLSRSSLHARDAYYGAMIGTAAGEAFAVRSAVPLGDPVQHFREFPMSASLLFPQVR